MRTYKSCFGAVETTGDDANPETINLDGDIPSCSVFTLPTLDSVTEKSSSSMCLSLSLGDLSSSFFQAADSQERK